VALGFVSIDDAAPLGCSHTYHQVQVVLSASSLQRLTMWRSSCGGVVMRVPLLTPSW
jgi:hypothetical protein